VSCRYQLRSNIFPSQLASLTPRCSHILLLPGSFPFFPFIWPSALRAPLSIKRLQLICALHFRPATLIGSRLGRSLEVSVWGPVGGSYLLNFVWLNCIFVSRLQPLHTPPGYSLGYFSWSTSLPLVLPKVFTSDYSSSSCVHFLLVSASYYLLVMYVTKSHTSIGTSNKALLCISRAFFIILSRVSFLTPVCHVLRTRHGVWIGN
jgi:hypothetical protein